MINISFLDTEKAVFLNEKYEDQLLKEYSDYLSMSLLQDELKSFTYDHIEKKLYMATNRGKILEFIL